MLRSSRSFLARVVLPSLLGDNVDARYYCVVHDDLAIGIFRHTQTHFTEVDSPRSHLSWFAGLRTTPRLTHHQLQQQSLLSTAAISKQHARRRYEIRYRQNDQQSRAASPSYLFATRAQDHPRLRRTHHRPRADPLVPQQRRTSKTVASQ